MYDLLSLNVKCPVCHDSLMDENHLVDNTPSIALGIEIHKRKGTIRLSSVYDSYNFICDIETPKNDIATIFCKHCNSELNSHIDCESCKAPMVPLALDKGGNISFCSRSGCTNHFVKLVDFSAGLKNLFRETRFKAHPYNEKMIVTKEEDDILTEEEKETKEIIESGTFLHTFCPKCKKTLIEDGMCKLKIVKDAKTSGYVILSPYLNIFTSRSTIFLPEGEEVGDVRCFHCDSSLMTEGLSCGDCNSHVATVSVSARTKMIDFHLCTRKGCRWHGLDKEDIKDIMLEDSNEW